jgi:hypothetical protein
MTIQSGWTALRHFGVALCSAACLWLLTISASGGARGAVLYVSATAAPGGNGSARAPFNSLAAVEAASNAGDTIIVLPAPLTVPPLDGGIALKPYQKLIGAGPRVVNQALGSAPIITNSSGANNSGDAVELSLGNTVENLRIINSYRGGIYGLDVGSASLVGNDLTGTNVSCTAGFLIYFPLSFNFIGPNGWAAIMVDTDAGTTSLLIASNSVHDGTCNDGIDVRAFGTASVTAQIDYNDVTRLAQGPRPLISLLALGLQARDSAQLSVDSAYNSETYIGSPGADGEGLFTNQTGGSIVWNIDHNTFAHGIGGPSTNGGEFFIGQGTDVTLDVHISNSSFEDDQGDMLESVNEATGSTMNLTLENVTVKTTALASGVPPALEPPVPTPTASANRAACYNMFPGAAQTVTSFTMINSTFSDCLTDGIISDYSNSQGPIPGPGVLSSVDIENSTITDVGDYALHWINYVTLDQLSIKAENSTFASAHGNAILGFNQAPGAVTHDAVIDFGGGPLHSVGQNCIFRAAAGTLDVEANAYSVFLQDNWWGNPAGPLPASISFTSGVPYITPVLHRPPTFDCVRPPLPGIENVLDH